MRSVPTIVLLGVLLALLPGCSTDAASQGATDLGLDAGPADVAGDHGAVTDPDLPPLADVPVTDRGQDAGLTDPGAAADPGADSVAVADVGPRDVAADAAALDAGAPDVGATDVGSAPDTAGCDYLDSPVILRCGGGYNMVLHWSDWGDPACPVYYTEAGVAYPSLDALAAALDCNAGCLYQATMAVSLLTCEGYKSGYEVYEAPEPCPGPVYATPEGLMDDLCEWSTNACNCTE